MGDASLMSFNPASKGLVVEADADCVVHIGGKVKVPRCVVRFVGTLVEAAAWINDRQPVATQGGYGSTLMGGDGSTLTGGYGSTLTGGYGSTLTGGDGSTLTGGDGSTLTGGDRSTLTGGDVSTLTGGDRSTLTGGDGSTLTGGDRSTLICRFCDGNRYRTKMAEVGDGGLTPGVKYRLTEEGVFIPVK
ncbi:MAG: hypothetical protein ABFD89_09210 [Bryobacteraceae bacterium]